MVEARLLPICVDSIFNWIGRMAVRKPGNFWKVCEQCVPTENTVSIGVLLFCQRNLMMELGLTYYPGKYKIL
jgi:hypothetical protein